MFIVCIFTASVTLDSLMLYLLCNSHCSLLPSQWENFKGNHIICCMTPFSSWAIKDVRTVLLCEFRDVPIKKLLWPSKSMIFGTLGTGSELGWGHVVSFEGNEHDYNY